MTSIMDAPQLVDALHWEVSRSNVATQNKYALSDLDDMDEKLVATLSTVRTRRNACLPVNRLVPETLAAIFSLFQYDVPDFRPVLSKISLNRWVVLAHVCRHWRNTLLAHASFWATLDMRKPRRDITPMFIERSRGAPLKIYYASPLPPTEGLSYNEMLESISPYCDQIREFHVLSYYNMSQRGWNCITSPAPLLESLTLSIRNADMQVGNPSLPPLFSDHTPRLRKIALHYFSSWPGNKFANLTHISLHRQAENGRYTLAQFLDFLQASPGLEELTLVKSGPNMDDILTPAQQHDPIPLDHLRILELGDWPSTLTISRFLSHLLFPTTTSLRIWGADFIQNDEDLSSLFSPCHSPQHDRLQSITKIRITDGPSLCGYFKSILVKDSILDIHGDFNAFKYLSISRVCDLSLVEELWFAPSPHREQPTLEEYKELFQKMPSLSTLVICKQNLHAMFLALGIFDTMTDTLPRPPLPCPNLTTLHVYSGSTHGPSLSVCLFAEKRAKGGHPIHQLQVEDFEPQDVEYLQRFVLNGDVKVVEKGHYRKVMLSPIWPNLPDSGYGWSYVPRYYD